VDDDLLHVRDDQQRRIQQRFTVLEQLLVSLIEVFVLAFVLPAKVALLPHIGPTLPAALLGGARLKGEGLAGGIRLGRRVVADQVAEVNEVLLGSRPFLERGLAPLGNEFLGGESG